MLSLSERFLPRINAMRAAVVEMRGSVDGITVGRSAPKKREESLKAKMPENSNIIPIESLKTKE